MSRAVPVSDHPEGLQETVGAYSYGRQVLNTTARHKRDRKRHATRLSKMNPFDVSKESRDLGEAISRILNVLSIDIYELAAVFGVELSDVVDWYSEKCDCDEIFKLIQGISNIADKIDELNIPQIGLFIRRPIFDGNSLLSLIKEQKDSPEIVNDLNQALAKIKSLADEKKSARKNRAESYKQEISQFKPLREINEITEIIDERG
jgi:hypothetical protein